MMPINKLVSQSMMVFKAGMSGEMAEHLFAYFFYEYVLYHDTFTIQETWISYKIRNEYCCIVVSISPENAVDFTTWKYILLDENNW